MDREGWLTTAEVAALLGVTHGHVRTQVARGVLPAQERAGRSFVARADVDQYRVIHLGRRGPKQRPVQSVGEVDE